MKILIKGRDLTTEEQRMFLGSIPKIKELDGLHADLVNYMVYEENGTRFAGLFFRDDDGQLMAAYGTSNEVIKVLERLHEFEGQMEFAIPVTISAGVKNGCNYCGLQFD